MLGMSRTTGKPLADEAHLAQSIGDLLSTPIGSRVIRRDYGSLLATLIDQPYNAVLRLRLFAASALAIARWEPRLALTRVTLDRDAVGAFTLTLDGRRTDGAAATSLTRLTVPLAGSVAT